MALNADNVEVSQVSESGAGGCLGTGSPENLSADPDDPPNTVKVEVDRANGTQVQIDCVSSQVSS